MKRILLVVAVVALYVLHQDFWNWRTPYPLVFGFIPIGLFYQGAFAVAASLVMWLLVKFAWPGHLEEEVQNSEAKEGTNS
jgi:amino acid transporter